MGYGETLARQIGSRIAAPFTAAADLAAFAQPVDGMTAFVKADRSQWIFDAANTTTDASGQLFVTPPSGSGRWVRSSRTPVLKFAVTFATADAAVLFTVPTGMSLRLTRVLWEVTTSFSGGASSAIGASSSNAAYNTKGDLLGGASGDLAATLVGATPAAVRGTLGTKFANSGIVQLVGGDTLRFDRIASAFTAGAGTIDLSVDVLS
jgi:hypothetical protein